MGAFALDITNMIHEAQSQDTTTNMMLLSSKQYNTSHGYL
jgi:hypothetical protein